MDGNSVDKEYLLKIKIIEKNTNILSGILRTRFDIFLNVAEILQGRIYFIINDNSTGRRCIFIKIMEKNPLEISFREGRALIFH